MHSLAMASLLIAAAGTGCAPQPSSSTAAVADQKAPSLTKPTTETVTLRDPVEDCFTVEVPKGWHNRAYTSRAFDVHREVVTCVSPNSDTVLFMGDPSIPQYWDPSMNSPLLQERARVNPMVKIQPAQTAQQYFPSYAKRKFGKLDKFAMGEMSSNEKVLNSIRELLQKHNMQARNVSAVDLPFTYEDKGKKMSAHLVGIALDFGGFWQVDVNGLSTAGKVADFLPMLTAISKSKKTNPAWTARQNAIHEEQMAQIRRFGEMMTAQHQQNMAWIQASAQRHQQRMQVLWEQSDASVRNYYQRSAASDLTHQRFLNYINDENTVVGSGGKTWQVTTGYDRYFVHKTNNSYLGGDIRFDLDEIRRRGLNPDDYEEVKIRN